MNCEETAELLPDYLQGRLNADRATVVEKHLAECADCGEEAALWKKLALLPEEQPSPALESRFKAMLESYQEGRWERNSLAADKTKTPAPMLWGLGNWRQVPAAGIVWACLFLVCGYFIGKHADRGPNTEVQKQLADLQGELAATHQCDRRGVDESLDFEQRPRRGVPLVRRSAQSRQCRTRGLLIRPQAQFHGAADQRPVLRQLARVRVRGLHGLPRRRRCGRQRQPG